MDAQYLKFNWSKIIRLNLGSENAENGEVGEECQADLTTGRERQITMGERAE